MCEKSQESQNGAKNTNRENRHIASLVVDLLLALNFKLFGIVIPYNGDDGTETKLSLATYLSARNMYLHRKKICPQAQVFQTGLGFSA